MSDGLDLADDIDKGAWTKMCKNISTVGFREGMAAGRDSVFQKGFDVGYHEGYMNGHSLGYIKGVTSIHNTFLKGTGVDDSEKPLDPDLEKTSRGMCVLCIEEKERTKQKSNSVTEIIEKQNKSVQHYIERLKTLKPGVP